MDQWKYLNIIADQKIKYAPVISVVHFWPNSVNFVDFFTPIDYISRNKNWWNFRLENSFTWSCFQICWSLLIL